MGLIKNNDDLKAAYKNYTFFEQDFGLLHGSITENAGRKTILLIVSKTVPNEVKEKFKKFILATDQTISQIIYIGEGDTQSKSQTMASIKINQPINFQNLFNLLRRGGNDISEQDLNRLLDALRKDKLIYRLASEHYVLREAGLKRVPHGPSRLSSDIARALVLARRKW